MSIHRVGLTDPLPSAVVGGAVTVGNFDGVHRGHAALIAELRRLAGLRRGPAVVVTFDPHPLAVLRPERLGVPLTTPDDRSELLQQAGADEVVFLPASRELLAMSAGTFLDAMLHDRFAVRAVVEGFNFGFGRERAGGIDTLRDWCGRRGVDLSIVPPLNDAGGPVSSSRIRDALASGDVAAAARQLGRPYRLRGTVGTGARRGRSIGFPTANLHHPETLIPADGVYAADVSVASGRWPAAVNVGPNPTFGGTAQKIEAHLIGFHGDLYGQPIALDFLDRIRDTKPFDSVEQLKAQLNKDVAAACRIHRAKLMDDDKIRGEVREPGEGTH